MSPNTQLFVFAIFPGGLFGASQSLLSSEYIYQAKVVCLRLFKHAMAWALALARARAGRSRPARIAMMAITTRSSIRVKPWANAPVTSPGRGADRAGC